MIRVSVELLPGGFTKGRKKLAEVHIANDGTGDPETGNYMAWFYHSNLPKRYRRKWHRGADNATSVVGFPRQRLNVLNLLARALLNAGYVLEK
jgi:hypothetical protein